MTTTPLDAARPSVARAQVFVRKEDLSLDVIKQYRVLCPTEQSKEDVLKDRILPACDKLGQTIVFCRTRKGASSLHHGLLGAGWKCTSISGDMRHEDRDRVIDEFRKGVTKILIATDVLSRGFDQSTVGRLPFVCPYHRVLAIGWVTI